MLNSLNPSKNREDTRAGRVLPVMPGLIKNRPASMLGTRQLRNHWEPNMDFDRQYWILAFICLTVFMAPFTRADETLLTDDGREVRLHDDGSWEFISNDRYANTPDGRRIRLRDNYTWEYLGNAPLSTKNQFRTTTTDLRLDSMLIQATEEKVHKNKRVLTRTYVTLAISRSPLAKQTLQIDRQALNKLSLADDKGNAIRSCS